MHNTRKEKKSLYNKLAWLFNYLILIPLISVMMVICFVLLSSTLNKSLPTVFDNHIVRIVSGSMQPEFERGDVVLVKKISSEELKTGDVIAYYRYLDSDISSAIWFHRITEICRDEKGYLWFKTKGDANALPDMKLVREDQVIGVYNKDAAWLHRFMGFAISKTGIILFIIVPSGLIIMCEGLLLINFLDKDEKKRKVSKKDYLSFERRDDVFSDNKENPGQLVKTITVKNPKGKDLDLNKILQNIEVLKTKRRLTAKMIMIEAVKLEKAKNKSRFQDENSKREIHKALNWCYERIGKIKYENKTIKDKTKNEKN